MSYTPPAYNAVNFDFGGSYTPPGSTAVDFDFGGGPAPPAGQESGVRRINLQTQTALFDPLWHPRPRTRAFAPIPKRKVAVLFSIT